MTPLPFHGVCVLSPDVPRFGAQQSVAHRIHDESVGRLTVEMGKAAREEFALVLGRGGAQVGIYS